MPSGAEVLRKGKESGGVVYVVRLPSLEFLRREVKMWEVSEEESKYGHKIRMVSPTSIKIVRKAVKIFRG